MDTNFFFATPLGRSDETPSAGPKSLSILTALKGCPRAVYLDWEAAPFDYTHVNRLLRDGRSGKPPTKRVLRRQRRESYR